MSIIKNTNANPSPQIIIVKSEEGIQNAFAKLALWLVVNDMKTAPIVYEKINTMIRRPTLYSISILRGKTSKTVAYVSPAMYGLPKTIHIAEKYADVFRTVFEGAK